jgi:hypothetical protein
MAEAPALPYARDEASTSQHLSAYPVYPDALDHDHEHHELSSDDSSEEEPAEAGAALQYWTSKRHRAGKGKGKVDDEYSESTSRF